MPEGLGLTDVSRTRVASRSSPGVTMILTPSTVHTGSALLKRASCVLFVVAFVLPAAARGQIRVGSEFQVNTYMTGPQLRPAVAADAAGSFVVAWSSHGQDGSGSGVFARWHDASGNPLGGAEFRVNVHTPGDQLTPSVASTPTGTVVVVWESVGQDGSGGGIFGRRYDAAGTPLDPSEFQINTYTTSTQRLPSVTSDASGNFVVVWQGNHDGSGYGVFARRYDAAGNALGDEFQVNSYTTSSQSGPAVASYWTGNFVVAWHSSPQDGNAFGVFAQRYDATGAPVGGEFRVNSYTTGNQFSPTVASDGSGNFVVAWDSDQGTGAYGIFAQRYDSAGVRQGGEFRVNAHTTFNQGSPALAAEFDGDFVVVWQSYTQDGSRWGTFGRRYDGLGTPEGPEFVLNTYTTGHQTFPAVASDASGRFVTLWDSEHGSVGIFGQRFVPDVIFRDGFETGTFNRWSLVSADGGDLSVSALAGLKFTTAGLRANVDDTAGLYVEDRTPDDEDRYRARCYFDPNGFDPGEAQNRRRTRIFIAFSEAPNRRLVAIVLRRIAGAYSIRGRAHLDDNSHADTPFIPITDEPHVIEFDLKRASGPGAADGYFELAIDGSWVSYLPLDNSLSAVDFVRMGALSVKPGATGTMHWDEFESRRQGDIGP
jgi:hypothetical protein